MVIYTHTAPLTPPHTPTGSEYKVFTHVVQRWNENIRQPLAQQKPKKYRVVYTRIGKVRSEYPLFLIFPCSRESSKAGVGRGRGGSLVVKHCHARCLEDFLLLAGKLLCEECKTSVSSLSVVAEVLATIFVFGLCLYYFYTQRFTPQNILNQ